MNLREELIDFYAWFEYRYKKSSDEEKDKTIGDVVDRYILENASHFTRKVTE